MDSCALFVILSVATDLAVKVGNLIFGGQILRLRLRMTVLVPRRDASECVPDERH